MPEQVGEEPRARDENSKKGLNILIADDEAAYRQLLTDLLNREGHQAEAVPDAEEALTKMKSKDYDLTFIDVYLPKRNGFELGNLLKEINPGLEIVFLTGDSSEETIDKMKRAGTLGYLTKPFKLKEIYDLVGKAS